MCCECCENGNDQLPDRRIEELLSQDQELATVRTDDPLESATSIMLDKNYSQLPVVSDEGKVKGVITWESIGKSLAGGVACKLVHECMDSSEKVACSRFDDRLVDPTDNIAAYGYVLVMEDDGMLKGILTASDLAKYFGKFAEGFLAIEEIEGRLERLIEGKFTIDEKSSAGGRRHCGRVTLTLGNYCKLLKELKDWNRLGLDICHKAFIEDLESVRCIRNRLMHFDARELKPEYLERLYKFLGLLRDLQ